MLIFIHPRGRRARKGGRQARCRREQVRSRGPWDGFRIRFTNYDIFGPPFTAASKVPGLYGGQRREAYLGSRANLTSSSYVKI